LPRRFKDEDGNFLRAPPGETELETQLYPIFGTTMEELGDFGDGVGLYFYTLRYFGIVALIIGLANIPIMLYFASNKYTGGGGQDWTQFPGIISKWVLKGSAICHQTSWQACPTCAPANWTKFPSTNDRFAYAYADINSNNTTCASNDWATFSSERSPLTFIKKNNCDLHDTFGIVSLVSVFLLLIAVYYFIFMHNKKAIEFDEAEQTTSDYSIVITNPPKDATEPESWKNFFESRFEDVHVTACTIVRNNKCLVKTLVRRRKLLLQLQDMLPAELYDEHDLEKSAAKCAPVPPLKKLFCFASDATVIVNAIYEEDKLIRKQSQKEYNISKVFVTFETQYAQRQVLEEMSSPILRQGGIRDRLRFKGIVLKAFRPTEPSGKFMW